MKPDLTYYPNSLRPLKNSLCFPKNPSTLSNLNLKNKQKNPLKKFLIFLRKKLSPLFGMDADQALK